MNRASRSRAGLVGRWSVLGALGLALVAAACGDDDDAPAQAAAAGKAGAAGAAGKGGQAGAGGACEKGTADCACLAGDLPCKGTGLSCVAGVCKPLACPPGAVACGCKPDLSCDAGLVCKAGTCGPATCVDGLAGCPCKLDGTCSAALACDPVKKLCAPESCPKGTESCPCYDNKSCKEKDGSPMLCKGGLCAPCAGAECGQKVLKPLDDGKTCFTPCETDLKKPDGTFVACDASKLMAACLDGKSCVDSACLAPGETPQNGCNGDVDCPDYMNCIAGACHPACSYDLDCPDGTRCFNHACRVPCAAASAPCPDKTACVVVDQQSGYCMPIKPPAPAVAPAPGVFSLSVQSLAFNVNSIVGAPETAVTLTNSSPQKRTFRLRKREHSELRTTGVDTVKDTDGVLPWLKWALGADPAQGGVELGPFTVEPNQSKTVRFEGFANPQKTRWEGKIEVISEADGALPSLGVQPLSLSYVNGPDGRWTGTYYSIATFGSSLKTSPETPLDAWAQGPHDLAALQQADNAFLRRWADFRTGLKSPDEIRAAITSMVGKSWDFASVKQACAIGLCYPYDGSPEGVSEFTNNPQAIPIPRGVSELPISFDIRAPDPSQPGQLTGKLNTTLALQYPGLPAVSIAFDGDPTACAPRADESCVVPLHSLDARVYVGGRFLTGAAKGQQGDGCGEGFKRTSVPWLIPYFTVGSDLDPDTDRRYQFECRSTALPFGDPSPSTADKNASLAGANPIPDGRPRARQLSLIDGALINQDTMLLILKESMLDPVLGADDNGGYGVAVVKRTAVALSEADVKGQNPTPPAAPADKTGALSCDDILPKLPGAKALDAQSAADIARTVLSGVQPGALSAPLDGSSAEKVHYLCHSNGKFDAGSDGLTACPAGSNVTFFTTQSLSDISIQSHPCQDTSACQKALDQWASGTSPQVRLAPVWRCKDTTKVFCDLNRLDLRAEKNFYPDNPGSPIFIPLRTQVDNVFQYKTQFRSRFSNSGVGFTPQPCVTDAAGHISSSVPYCYHAQGIEEVRARVDCLLAIYQQYTSLDPSLREDIKQYLASDFGYDELLVDGQPPEVREGFEHMNAELLIMLGDDAYTKAFAARFDLAGTQIGSFEGSKFEPGGIDLSGGAGNEMLQLYLAAQYYQATLDRFYRSAPLIIQESQPLAGVVTDRTVTTYFGRLIRASTQKARAWSAAADRYQNFNRPDLARLVIERAYSAAYLESIVLGRAMQRVLKSAPPQKKDQLTVTLEDAQRSYRVALLEMRDAYGKITDDQNFFGYAPDYIPFPVVEPGEPNAFEKLYKEAEDQAAKALSKEKEALESKAKYDTDAEEFKQQLGIIKNNYNGQLGDLCGTFTGSDGKVSPAVPAFAYLDKKANALGDPCGMMGNGQLFEAMGAVDQAALQARAVVQSRSDILARIEIERERASKQCGVVFDLAVVKYSVQGKINSMQNAINGLDVAISGIERTLTVASTVSQLANCSVSPFTASCGNALVAAGTYVAISAIGGGLIVASQIAQTALKSEIADIEKNEVFFETTKQCDVIKIDSEAKMKELLLELKAKEIEALKAQYDLALAIAKVGELRNKASSTIAEEEDTEQLANAVAAAKNDPNVRIYKNDAILTADRTFQGAVRAAYEATKVFEYYTSQSYAHRDDLFLVRMIGSGDISLEKYLDDLDDAYKLFQQQFGKPDKRVEILSLRDDILVIPRLGLDGKPLTQADRIQMFQDRLSDSRLLDGNGYLTIPFATNFARLSPLTRNHKISTIEAEIIGSDVGDPQGRIYLKQSGTSTVFTVTDDKLYYRIPERTAVINTFFNGTKAINPELYPSERFRDRPYANTRWEFSLNQKDEAANQDINLKSLTDIRLYVFYTDFTKL